MANLGSTYVIKNKPLFYKLGAKVFRYLRDCNKIVEYEKLGRILETNKGFRGRKFDGIWVDELSKKDSNGSKE